jgi:pullulanase
MARILEEKKKQFVLWFARKPNVKPKLIIGRFVPGNPPTVPQVLAVQMSTDETNEPGLWRLAPDECKKADGTAYLEDGLVYHYWFEVEDSRNPTKLVWCTDPLALMVDWRALAPAGQSFSEDSRAPASVVLFRGGELVATDPNVGVIPPVEGQTIEWKTDDPNHVPALPSNNELVIYELPTRWSRLDLARLFGVGTLRDVRSLVDGSVGGNFSGLGVTSAKTAYLLDLGINALELLPPADSEMDREWGYGTAHFMAVDMDLGFPKGNSWPTPLTDFVALVEACHKAKIRVFADVVMGYGRRDPYQTIDYESFHCDTRELKQKPDGNWEEEADVYAICKEDIVGDGQEQCSSRHGKLRQAWGGSLFRFIRRVENVWDPISGKPLALNPAAQFLLVTIEHWIRELRIDGIRLDSIETIANWDFVRTFRDHAQAIYADKWKEDPKPGEGFLVDGEELETPTDLVKDNWVDAIWNERFKQRIRFVIVGKHDETRDADFRASVQRLVDCRKDGFPNAWSAINYLGTHDTQGSGNERIADYLDYQFVYDKETRLKLAFTVLMTAVGVPMILAGDEFGAHRDPLDEQLKAVINDFKQYDGVNYELLDRARRQEASGVPDRELDDRWRHRLFLHVKRLIALRKQNEAFREADVTFPYDNYDDGRRVVAWIRKGQNTQKQALVVANFSGCGDAQGQAWTIPYIPPTPTGMTWRDVFTGAAMNEGKEQLAPWFVRMFELS